MSWVGSLESREPRESEESGESPESLASLPRVSDAMTRGELSFSKVRALTRLDNLILLCRHHHRALHEEGFRVRLRSDGSPRFSHRTGWPLPDFAPPTPAFWEDPVQTLRRKNRARGVRPDAWTASSRWDRSGDIPWKVEARVREVVER